MRQTNSVKSNRKAIFSLTLAALFAALTAAGTFISIPLPFSPVPIVLQNLFAMLSGLVLGPVTGSGAVALYLVAGAIGFPVFTGASGGFVHLIGPTGGFLFGYLLSAFTSGLIAGKPRAGKKSPLWRIILASAAGMLIIYVPGVIRLKFALDSGWAGALAAGFFPFLIGDLIKAVSAVIIAARLRPLLAERFGEAGETV
ncbi:MAG: biotin transporter BioY [Treponema sp.]|nr:biotin transporter BioY [Treponema sp.]